MTLLKMQLKEVQKLLLQKKKLKSFKMASYLFIQKI